MHNTAEVKQEKGIANNINSQKYLVISRLYYNFVQSKYTKNMEGGNFNILMLEQALKFLRNQNEDVQIAIRKTIKEAQKRIDKKKFQKINRH